MSKYRAEKWTLAFDQETTYGAVPSATSKAKYLFGAFDDATLPDPEYEHQPMWMLKSAVDRNYSIAYRGKARYSGSIPDVVLLDGRPVYLPFTDVVIHTGVAVPYVHTISTANAGATAGLKSFRIMAQYYDDSGTAGLFRTWTGGKVNRATFHCEEGGMLMMSLDEILFNSIFFDTAEAEGEDVRIIPFYNANVSAADMTFVYPTSVEPTVEPIATEVRPYYFSDASIKMKLVQYNDATTSTLQEVTIPTVSNFRLEINNNIVPKYYLSDAGADDQHGPYELLEGRQEIRLAMTVELADYDDLTNVFYKDDIFRNLIRQGRESDTTYTPDYTSIKGVGINIRFAKAGDAANDYIDFKIPGDYTPAEGLEEQGALIIRAPHNIVTEGLVSVPMEMICRNVITVVADRRNEISVAEEHEGYPDVYPTV